MWRKTIYSLLPLFILAAGFYYYTQNFPHIFDIALYDESGYMHRGEAAGLLNFSNYEWGPLYSLFYRAVSVFVGDPVDVFMVGGLLVLSAAFLLGALSTQLLSGNPILAVLLAALPLFAGVFVIWPRVSFLVIAMLGAAIPLALRLGRTADKAALLTVVAFLLTFVRPEYITAFYLMLAIAAASFLWTLWSQGRVAPGSGRTLITLSAVPGLSIAAVAALALAWSLPIPAGHGRAFMAFGQHYALRYVSDHGLPVSSWQTWLPIMAREFPGASTVGAAFQQAPGKVLHFYGANLADMIEDIWQTGRQVIDRHALFFGVGAAILIAGAVWQLRAVRRNRGPAWMPDAARSGLAVDLLLIGVLGLPPLLGCILVYPRLHYIIMVEFVTCLLLARALRGRAPPFAPALAAGLGIFLVFSIQPLPSAPQPNVAIIRSLRTLPPVRQMVENDGGWCYYLPSRCAPYFLNGMTDATELHDLMAQNTFDAVLISPSVRSYAVAHPNLGLDFLFADASHPGWISYPLAPGYTIFYRRGALAVSH
ncbi:MAG TPA: hypothetical protein VH184_17745 [Dongiaceae bacterium]|jgi:hypothetical protein|nr:hypothetical protein [Dongiaceae bacterium]